MTKYYPIEKIRRISKESRRVLFGDIDLSESIKVAGHRVPYSTTKINRSDTTRDKPSQDIIHTHKKPSKAFDNALKMIKAQTSHDIPFLFRNEAAQLSGLSGGGLIALAEKKALDKGLIRKHFIPRAKTNICFLEVTELGYELLGIPKPAWQSKGAYPHKFCAHRIKLYFENRGYMVVIEARLKNNKLLDLKATKPGSLIYVEICASFPIEKEISNIRKDLEIPPFPDEFIIAVTDRKMKIPLYKAIRETGVGKDSSVPIRVEYAGNLIEFLDIKK